MDILVLDGGASSELTRAGFDFINDPLWSSVLLVSNTEDIKRVHRSFLESGADIIQSVSYQANFDFFQKYQNKTKEEAVALTKLSVQLAKESVEEFWAENKDSGRRKPLVCGCLGPLATYKVGWSEYTGDYFDHITEDDVKNYQRPRIKALVEAGADIIALETVPVLKEGEIVASLMKEFPNTEAWVSFSCEDGEHLRHGEKFSDAVKVVCASGVVKTVGINCTSPDVVSCLLRSAQRVKDECNAKFVVYPNSGEVLEDPSVPQSPWVGRNMAMDFPSYVPEWIKLGASIIGGCCRTTPSDVKVISNIVRGMVRKLCEWYL